MPHRPQVPTIGSAHLTYLSVLPSRPHLLSSPLPIPYSSAAQCTIRCPWRRVLGSGLSEATLEQLDRVFQRSLELQDGIVDQLQHPDPLFQERIQALEMEIKAVKGKLQNPGITDVFLGRSLEIVENVKEMIADSRQQSHRLVSFSFHTLSLYGMDRFVLCFLSFSSLPSH